MRISAVVRDQQGEGARNAQVKATVRGPGGRSDDVVLTADPAAAGNYAAQFEPTTAGSYQIVVQARLGDELLESEAIAAEVGRPNLEFERLDLDDKLLGQIASATGGRTCTSPRPNRSPNSSTAAAHAPAIPPAAALLATGLLAAVRRRPDDRVGPPPTVPASLDLDQATFWSAAIHRRFLTRDAGSSKTGPDLLRPPRGSGKGLLPFPARNRLSSESGDESPHSKIFAWLMAKHSGTRVRPRRTRGSCDRVAQFLASIARSYRRESVFNTMEQWGRCPHTQSGCRRNRSHTEEGSPCPSVPLSLRLVARVASWSC